MCLLILANQINQKYKMILAANRDEFYDRPAEAASFWKDYPDLLAGKDLKGGGTWLGVTKSGRIAAITNYRSGLQQNENAPSRGEIVKNFLVSGDDISSFSENLSDDAAQYNKFNLIFGTIDSLFFFSNVSREFIKIDKGIIGLSNCSLDTPWPKVTTAKLNMENLLKSEFSEQGIFKILSNQDIFSDNILPDTGVGLELERILSSIFIKTPFYGTRTSTIIKITYDNNLEFIEKTFEHGEETGTVNFSFNITQF